MNKAILMLLLVVVSSSSVADWVRVGSIDSDNLVVYANPDTLYKTGSRVSMWNLIDFSAIQRSAGSTSFHVTTYLSVKAQHEYDCKERQQRILSYFWHAKNMGNGTVVLSDDTQDEWSPVPPCSINEILLKYVCRKSQGAS